MSFGVTLRVMGYLQHCGCQSFDAEAYPSYYYQCTVILSETYQCTVSKSTEREVLLIYREDVEGAIRCHCATRHSSEHAQEALRRFPTSFQYAD